MRAVRVWSIPDFVIGQRGSRLRGGVSVFVLAGVFVFGHPKNFGCVVPRRGREFRASPSARVVFSVLVAVN